MYGWIQGDTQLAQQARGLPTAGIPATLPMPARGQPITAPANPVATPPRSQGFTQNYPIPGGGWMSPGAYSPRRPPFSQFPYNLGGGMNMAAIGGMFGKTNGVAQQPQQQGSPFPFDLPGQMGLGNFYTPHGMGDAQNVPNSTIGANFLGSGYMPRRRDY